jgi:hypothetical protein
MVLKLGHGGKLIRITLRVLNCAGEEQRRTDGVRIDVLHRVRVKGERTSFM